MQAASSRLSDILVIRPAGRIDHLNAAELGQLLAPHIDACRSGGDKLVIDLGQIDYISSAGLRELMLVRKQTEPQGGEIVLAGAQRVVREILEISRFNLVFPIYDDADAAIKALGGKTR